MENLFNFNLKNAIIKLTKTRRRITELNHIYELSLKMLKVDKVDLKGIQGAKENTTHE